MFYQVYIQYNFRQHFETHRVQFLPVNLSPEEEGGVADVGGSGCLHEGGVDDDGVGAVEVRVDHDGRAPPQVHVLLPPSDVKKKKTVFSNRVFFTKKTSVFFKKKPVFFFFKYGININTQVETTLLWDLFSIYDTVSNYFTPLLLI